MSRWGDMFRLFKPERSALLILAASLMVWAAAVMCARVSVPDISDLPVPKAQTDSAAASALAAPAVTAASELLDKDSGHKTPRSPKRTRPKAPTHQREHYDEVVMDSAD